MPKVKPKNIVVIGGGSGSYAVLKGLKPYAKNGLINITAIVAMTDSGGNSGALRDEFGILPPGDIRRCLVALSDETEIVKQLFQHRFESNGTLNEQSFGNLFLTALTQILGSEEKAIKEAHKILKVYGNIIPVTLENAHLVATLEDGEKIIGESVIDLPRHNSNKKIINLTTNTYINANPEALKAIKNAEVIIIGPGDLFTSIIANIIIDGIAEYLKYSRAKKVYICNIMTKNGETNNFDVHAHLHEIEKYCGGQMNFVLYNNKKIPQDLLLKYKTEGAEQVIFNPKKEKNKTKFIGADFTTNKDIARHDSKKIGKELMKIILDK